MRQLYIITGAKGHLASTIIRYLRKQDCEIRGLILPSETGEDDERLTYYKGDVTKPETLDDIFMNIEDREVIVIHTAAIISIGETVTPQLYRVNVCRHYDRNTLTLPRRLYGNTNRRFVLLPCYSFSAA